MKNQDNKPAEKQAPEKFVPNPSDVVERSFLEDVDLNEGEADYYDEVVEVITTGGVFVRNVLDPEGTTMMVSRRAYHQCTAMKLTKPEEEVRVAEVTGSRGGKPAPAPIVTKEAVDEGTQPAKVMSLDDVKTKPLKSGLAGLGPAPADASEITAAKLLEVHQTILKNQGEGEPDKDIFTDKGYVRQPIFASHFKVDKVTPKVLGEYYKLAKDEGVVS